VSPLTSRRVFGGALLARTGALAVRQLCSTGFLRDRRRRRSRVAILHEDSYDGPLDRTLIEGLRLFDLNLRGKAVLLKPNLVEYIPGAEVNTNPRLVGAAASAFLALGAKTVLVGEGPGHQRDTVLVLAEGGLEAELRERRIRFVDLNRDEIRKVPLETPFTGLDCLWLPRTVLTSDLVVSMPKVKTHHWAGVTLSMKNLFGVMPGVAYGWPKNLLHWKGIDRSILDINAAVPAAARPKDIHPATRAYQALRIAVNEEFEALESGLRQAIDLLKPGGRIAVISYHSGEDRIVKQLFALLSGKCLCPPSQPVCICEARTPKVKSITKKPVTPSASEIAANPRARRDAQARRAER